VIYRLADANTSDDPARIPAWDTLVKLTGGPGFLYVADCKLCRWPAFPAVPLAGLPGSA
jgi:hypothetical protein